MANTPTDSFWKLTHDIRTCMMTSERDGLLASRPMASYPRREAGKVYFITRLDTDKTREIADGEPINLAYADPSSNTWLSVEGTARVVRDEALQQELWNWFAEAYVPEGPRDPNVGLIEVTPAHATLWQGASWTITELWKTAVANVLQEEPSTKKEEVRL